MTHRPGALRDPLVWCGIAFLVAGLACGAFAAGLSVAAACQ